MCPEKRVVLCQVVGLVFGLVVGLVVGLVTGQVVGLVVSQIFSLFVVLVECEALSWIFVMCFCVALTEAVAS